MSSKKIKLDLSKLPLRFQTRGNKYWIDTHTGKLIHQSKIQDYLPKEEPFYVEPKQDWTRRYYDN